MTSDLVKRVYEHKHDLVDGFTKRYSVHALVYYELCTDMFFAIEREKQLKNWQRKWKIELVEGFNPNWRDLYSEIV